MCVPAPILQTCCHVSGFTDLLSNKSALLVVRYLDTLFSKFDEVAAVLSSAPALALLLPLPVLLTAPLHCPLAVGADW